MKINIIIAVMFIAAAAACSGSRKLTKSQTGNSGQSQIQGTSKEGNKNSANNNTPVVKQQKAEKKDDARPMPNTGSPDNQSPLPRPKITFSTVESANVRVPGINPIPAGGLDVDLAKLKQEFCYPYRGKVISNYGMRGRSMHTGVDIKAVPGDTIRAVLGGVVRLSKVYSGYGNLVVIQHWCGFETAYGHNIRNLVDVNDVVEAGTPIALAGRTGRATTEHLHFEVRAAGEPVNPSLLLDYSGMTINDGILCFRYKGGKVVGSIKGSKEEPDRENVISTAAKSQEDGSQKYHIVRKGDTLYRIAVNNRTTVKELQRLNSLKDGSTLSIGQKIKLK